MPTKKLRPTQNRVICMSNNDSTKWTSSDDKFVLYMDIMGFKEKVNKSDFSDLQREFINLCTNWKNRIKPLMKGNHLDYYQFSDSIILTTDKADSQALNIIIRAAATIMQESMLLKFPVNGVLAKGQFSFDKTNQLFFGKALVEAYLLQTSLFYYGVVLHPNTDSDIKCFLSSDDQKYKKTGLLLERMPIPLKGGNAGYYQICWGCLSKENDIKDNTTNSLNSLEIIEQGTTGNPRIYVANTRKVLLENQKKINSQNHLRAGG